MVKLSQRETQHVSNLTCVIIVIENIILDIYLILFQISNEVSALVLMAHTPCKCGPMTFQCTNCAQKITFLNHWHIPYMSNTKLEQLYIKQG